MAHEDDPAGQDEPRQVGGGGQVGTALSPTVFVSGLADGALFSRATRRA